MDRSIKIAIVDTGIDKNHEYLKDSIIGGIGFECKDDYIFISNNFDDKNGHGTSCASVIKREFENAEFFIVRALDELGRTNIQILEESLKYLLDKDINIINLSLSVIESELIKDLYSICEQLNNQGKIIVCSVANGFEYSYPAKFDTVIGVKGFILDDENSFWYNKKETIQCIMDNNSYLNCDLNNSYKLFGNCNSQAAAKLTGKIANILEKRNQISLEELNKELEKMATKNIWTNNDLKESKRFPKFMNGISCNKSIFKEVEKIIKDTLDVQEVKFNLWELSLFSKYIGLNEDNCFDIIKKIETKFEISLNPLEISKYDFISIYTLVNLIENNIKKG